MPYASVNPATGETVRTFASHTDDQVEHALARAWEAFEVQKRTPIHERAARLARAGDLLEAETETIARTMTLEVGKTLKSSREEVAKCALACRFYAGHATDFLADRPYDVGPDARAFVRPLPLGPVLAVMPWNFPLWQAVRFAAPALVAGNVGLLKPAESVPQCALILEDVFRRAGFAEGVFQTLLIEVDQVPAVLDDPRVRGATLTGSGGAGSGVAARAGRNLKKTVLELGGSDPFVVMPSADLAAAVQAAVKSRTVNNGQSCIAAKRFIVHEAVADEFEEKFVAGMAALTVGDPLDSGTDIGPLALLKILDGLASQVDRSVRAGARVLLGGHRLPGPGFWYAPTVLADIPRDAPAYAEELFGPVALLFRIGDLSAAIAQANDTPFGLGSSVWTEDPAERAAFTEGLDAGMTYFNSPVVSDPRVPFGGVKASGYGRELSDLGLFEFTNLKTVWVSGADSGGADTE